MAKLYKKTLSKKCPRTGKPLSSKKWWGRYRDNGIVRRVPLATDKSVAQSILDERVRKAERRAAGIIDKFEEHGGRPLRQHLAEFGEHLSRNERSVKHVQEVTSKLRAVMDSCRWLFLADISATDVERFLADLRQSGRSIQTSNHYLRAVKQFLRWLSVEGRLADDPLTRLKMLNVRVDRRHERRSLSSDEFGKLMSAAEAGETIETISGADRAAMYLCAAMTGFRKAEIASLTRQSFQLDAVPPTVTVKAAFSKRRRQDTQVLHPDLVTYLHRWLESKSNIDDRRLLWPVSSKIRGGTERKTNKMMRLDLQHAGVPYRNEHGHVADFHALRHTFVTNLAKANVSPKTAQLLARHSNVDLTLGVYTHSDLADQVEAINRLSMPERMLPLMSAAGGTEKLVVPPVVLSGAQNGAEQLALPGASVAPSGSVSDTREEADEVPRIPPKSLPVEALDNVGQEPARHGSDLTPPLRESTPYWARTSNLRFRRPMLYPIELRVQRLKLASFSALATVDEAL